MMNLRMKYALKPISIAQLTVTAILIFSEFAVHPASAFEQSPFSAPNEYCHGEHQNGSDLTMLQGKWRIVSISLQGKKFRAEDKIDAWKEVFETEVTIQGDQFIHSKTTGGKIEIVESQQPKQINFKDKDGKLSFHGIYALENDSVTMCINGNSSDGRRPSEFATKASNSFVLISLKKIVAK